MADRFNRSDLRGKHVVVLPDEAGLNGLQDIRASVIPDIEKYFSAAAIFERMRLNPVAPEEAPSNHAFSRFTGNAAMGPQAAFEQHPNL
jgi:hypothetical protein